MTLGLGWWFPSRLCLWCDFVSFFNFLLDSTLTLTEPSTEWRWWNGQHLPKCSRLPSGTDIDAVRGGDMEVQRKHQQGAVLREGGVWGGIHKDGNDWLLVGGRNPSQPHPFRQAFVLHSVLPIRWTWEENLGSELWMNRLFLLWALFVVVCFFETPCFAGFFFFLGANSGQIYCCGWWWGHFWWDSLIDAADIVIKIQKRNFFLLKKSSVMNSLEGESIPLALLVDGVTHRNVSQSPKIASNQSKTPSHGRTRLLTPEYLAYCTIIWGSFSSWWAKWGMLDKRLTRNTVWCDHCYPCICLHPTLNRTSWRTVGCLEWKWCALPLWMSYFGILFISSFNRIALMVNGQQW